MSFVPALALLAVIELGTLHYLSLRLPIFRCNILPILRLMGVVSLWLSAVTGNMTNILHHLFFHHPSLNCSLVVESNIHV